VSNLRQTKYIAEYADNVSDLTHSYFANSTGILSVQISSYKAQTLTINDTAINTNTLK
jgi:hypothetical protein